MTMNSIYAQEALDCRCDYLAISPSVARLACQLQPFYPFPVRLPNGTILPAADPTALEQAFGTYLGKAQQFLLSSLLTGSNNIGNYQDYARSLSESDRADLENKVTIRAWAMAKGYFLEALCILADLSTRTPVKSHSALRLFKKFGPVLMQENGQDRFLWYQSTLAKTQSGMDARPDILITTVRALDRETIIGYRECKCRPVLSSGDIRKEFGKAFDLKAKSYVIVCYYQMPDRIKDAARKLGLEIEELGLYSENRDEYLSASLIEESSNGQHLRMRLRIKTHRPARASPASRRTIAPKYP